MRMSAMRNLGRLSSVVTYSLSTMFKNKNVSHTEANCKNGTGEARRIPGDKTMVNVVPKKSKSMSASIA